MVFNSLFAINFKTFTYKNKLDIAFKIGVIFKNVEVLVTVLASDNWVTR